MPIPDEVREAAIHKLECFFNDRSMREAVADAALSALEAAGWACVPKEITLEMQHAYFNVIDKNMERVETDASFGRYASNKEAYAAMLASTQGKG